MNKTDHGKIVLDIQNRKGTTSQQPIRCGIATKNQTAKESERWESEEQPIRRENASETEMTQLRERTESSENAAINKQERQTIKSINASISCDRENSSNMNSLSDSDACKKSIIEFLDKPPLKTPICYSVNQIEIIQNLGSYTFAAQFQADDFLQKIF